ncbi:MAG TPA: hypothetical protein VFM63_07755 [Pyrinomonadaceae bacterium]|nr:hypothetical protein [Pyrinomonadaceae bacterium]
MFIRFVSREIDEDSRVSAGLFRAADKLINEVWLPDYEYDALREPMNWFDEHLKTPYDFRLEPADLADRSVCWFRSTAKEHLRRAWEMVAVLEERDILIRMIKTEDPGYILYEDEVQVLAFPNRYMRRLLKQ